MKPRIVSLKGPIKMVNLKPGWSGKKKQINHIRNESSDITTDSTNIKRLLREYYEKLLLIKGNNLGEIDKLLPRQQLPKLTQG